MGENSNISWTGTQQPDGTWTPGATWNPVVGCSKVSSGCQNCYAETLALRFGWSKHPWNAFYAKENVVLKPHKLPDPFKYKEPKRVFVNSLSDVFHEQIPDSYIDAMFFVMSMNRRHTFQILTKRPQRMYEYVTSVHKARDIYLAGLRRSYCEWPHRCEPYQPMWPLPNVWLGVSVEDQPRADERVPILIKTPAAVRFLSCEPLLGPVNVLHDPFGIDPGCGWINEPYMSQTEYGPEGTDDIHSGIDWVIVGGESGKGYRTMNLDWARDLRQQCVDAQIAFFYKQGSGPRPGMNAILDGVEWHQFPEAHNATAPLHPWVP